MASILVIDGDADERERSRESLELDGHRVTTAADGVEALSAVAAAPAAPDVIVGNTELPELDGWTLLERLKQDDDPSVSQIPVLLVSAAASESDEIRAGIEGALALLSKPVSPQVLRDAVIGALSGSEVQLRRRTQVAALERLARRESGHEPDVETRVNLTRLERVDHGLGAEQANLANGLDVETLTEKQAGLLEALREAPSVSAAAQDLGVSRSSIYASLRRICRKLDVGSVQALLHVLRTDQLPK